MKRTALFFLILLFAHMPLLKAVKFSVKLN